MGLVNSRYDGGKRCSRCPRCGAVVRSSYRTPFSKCIKCANEIAAEVEKEFKENLGHYITEAIMATGNEKLIDAVVKGAKILEESTEEIKELPDATDTDPTDGV